MINNEYIYIYLFDFDDGKTLYTNDGPPPNSTDISNCMPLKATGDGKYFHPTEVCSSQRRATLRTTCIGCSNEMTCNASFFFD